MDRQLKQIEIYASNGAFESSGPKLADRDRTFTSAVFHPDGKHLVVCEMIGDWRTSKQVIRSWNIERQEYEKPEYSEQSDVYSHVRGFLNDREVLASSAAWRVDIVDPLLGEMRRRIEVSGRAQGLSRSDVRQEFCIGTSSGMVHFHDLETFEPIGSPMQVGDHVFSVAYTGDGKWLATVSRTKDRQHLSFWHLEGEAPFDSIVMRLPFAESKIYPYGERGIVFAQDGEIMVLELPEAFADLRRAELECWAATGLRSGPGGQVELISGEQLRRYRDELTLIRATGQ